MGHAQRRAADARTPLRLPRIGPCRDPLHLWFVEYETERGHLAPLIVPTAAKPAPRLAQLRQLLAPLTDSAVAAVFATPVGSIISMSRWIARSRRAIAARSRWRYGNRVCGIWRMRAKSSRSRCSRRNEVPMTPSR